MRRQMWLMLAAALLTAAASFFCERDECMLPKGPVILLSYVNTKLRDEYPTLEDLCTSLDISPDDLQSRLAAVGFTYDPATNQFR